MTKTSEHVLDVVPQPAPRPRFSKWGGAYFPASYTAHKAEIAKALPKYPGPPLESELSVAVEFVCKPIAKSKFTTPSGDLDNLAKPLLDVLTQSGWYGDDRQIVYLATTKRFPDADEAPHIRFQITELT
jgi:Holliday junction resolvase RusA-like endonuclease